MEDIIMRSVSGVLIFVFIFFCLSCGDIDRDNSLDPKNSASERRQVTLIEAFVNDDSDFSLYALEALNDLESSRSTDEALFLEYHLPISNHNDDYVLPENINRYNELATENRFIPDVFFNGYHRVQGASSSETAETRYREALTQVENSVSNLTIEASLSTINNNLDVEVNFARLGDEPLTNFSLHAVAFADEGNRHNHVVRLLLPVEQFSRIEPGEHKSKTLIGNSQAGNPANWNVVVFIQKGTEVLQAILAEKE